MMAKETKVGLLAGLGFIICFAVILTNKGGPARPASRTTLADARRSAAPAQPSRDPAATNRSNASRRQADSRARTIPTGSSRAIPALHVPVKSDPPTSGQRTAERRRSPANAADRRPGSSPAQGPASDEDRARQQTPLTSVPVEQDTGAGRPDNGTRRPAEALSSSASPPEQRAAPAPSVSTLHVVSAGETLSKIAARYYGKGTRANIDRLVSANPVELSNPDVIRVGMKLQVPDVPGTYESAASPRAAAPGGTPPDRRPAQPIPATRWYQIRKGDRYIDIARNELGDASRWEEIFELNIDKFPDPGNIREGVRIKLPAQDAHIARGGRP